jgi:hypothetical protein
MGDSTRETKYLDLDGDGVPDAVETTETKVAMIDDGVHRMIEVEVLDEIDSEITIDGVPGSVEVSDTVIVEDVGDGDPGT